MQPEVPHILDRYKALIRTRANDHNGFFLSESLVEAFPFSVLSNFLPTLLEPIVQRLGGAKSLKFVKSFLVFLSVFLSKHDPTQVIEAIDSWSTPDKPPLFGGIIFEEWLPHIQKVEGQVERKVAAIAMTRLLTNQLFFQKYEGLWGRLLDSQVKLFALPEDKDASDGDNFVDIEDQPGYTSGFAPLAFALKADIDPLPEVDAMQSFVEGLVTLSQAVPLKDLIPQALHPEAQTILRQFLQKAGAPSIF